jgi:hypothetical protein
MREGVGERRREGGRERERGKEIGSERRREGMGIGGKGYSSGW